MPQPIQAIETFGDTRKFLLETVIALRDKKMDNSTGLAIAANLKVLNDNIQAEIAATKLSIQTEGTAHKFGRVVQMGKRMIADNGVVS